MVNVFVTYKMIDYVEEEKWACMYLFTNYLRYTQTKKKKKQTKKTNNISILKTYKNQFQFNSLNRS